MTKVGFVALDQNQNWLGGRYYLQNLIKCNSTIDSEEKINICDVWWENIPESDPFIEVRQLLGSSIIVKFPNNLIERIKRRINRILHKHSTASDLFKKHDIDLFFPIQPCENTGIPYVFWLPDFQHIRRPDLLTPDLIEYFNTNYSRNVKEASQVILSSEDAKNDFVQVYPDYIEKAHVVHFCSIPDSSWWELDPLETSQKHQLPERFFIVCNQFTRHKNYLTLFKSLSYLRELGQKDICIVCTGGTYDYRGENYFEKLKVYIAEHHLEGQVRILGLLPKAEQVALMRRSIAILQPSQFEGWSTVIEDAKTLGKLVLASNLEVNCEQLGVSHPFYLEPENFRQWAIVMQQIWSNTPPGPNLLQEKAGLEYLNLAAKDCGLKFAEVVNEALR
ncbi:glycosyltransferase family 4 protein [Pseudanabaena mucicola]|uniref:Glycosyltransferase family 4 protein n=1 Tax=Pseudanabaena mucicola FACHB-723 TaxID=2692860 RepID=A0ABR7ZV05_9CYAN|nr:glycosyltransferase family 1 protein [Pseudanabaena mucicola]MBD2187096.1 glycosyltransferase family 4 protein [Pseudanabaena mucicola FACHB-723]